MLLQAMTEPATPFASADARWDAFIGRDPAADGRFVAAVTSTGIYCRPSCPARKPKRENVRFYATPAEAEAAGFRACKRCRPQAATAEATPAARHAAAVAEACRRIAEAEEPPSLDDLAQAAGLSRFHFHRVFKEATGLTPKAYATAERARRLREGLGRSATVTEAIYDAGYNASSRFYSKSTKLLGMTPTAWRAGGAGTRIRFAVGQCAYGAILAAASDKGVCAILLGDDPEALVRGLEDSFPKAELIGGDAAFEQWMARIVGFVEQPGLGLDLPLDLRGTAFQQRVWRALSEIPVGATVSYAEIAQRIGQPKAVRAVAQACGANRLAVAIPCHRVVRSDGDVSGYRWGVERKRAILAREAAERR
ncbi:MAG: bifunctional DNA-binding transcriptional regulator/O6-methylguanine-DNA methyltransferase Ada [Bacteroidota bacterium]|nr:bifunctional DNA-binding transcriptional regulator/O6-methylguanine-DNA methyltransferase Ada [Kiloniellaceae bacterium]